MWGLGFRVWNAGFGISVLRVYSWSFLLEEARQLPNDRSGRNVYGDCTGSYGNGLIEFRVQGVRLRSFACVF